MKEQIKLTEASAGLFASIVKDLPNWSDLTPCCNHITKESRGNLTQLKRQGLIKTFQSDGEEWIELTPSGKEYANEIGIGNCSTR